MKQFIPHSIRATLFRIKNFSGKVLSRIISLTKPKISLLILDDIFPQPLSSFRLVEFTAYLQQWPDAVVYSTAASFPLVNETRSLSEVIKSFEHKNPNLLNRISYFNRFQAVNPKVAYLVFINNAFSMLPFLEERKIPFIFTLYPGGGFALQDELSDYKLRCVFNSIFFRHVIVSQNITRNYLLENNFCDSTKITLVYGVVMPSDKLTIKNNIHLQYPVEKKNFDICFVAHKYTQRGVDKGYDIFIAAAHLLAHSLPNARFHIVGNFTPNDIDVSNLQNISFYGSQQTDFFPSFYANMDIILSPNVAFRLQPGAFDGFPTGSCVEAGLCGVVIMCTDELGQNIYLQDGKNIILCNNKTEDIVTKIIYYHNHPQELYEIAKAGQLRLRELFSSHEQLSPRISLLDKFIS